MNSGRLIYSRYEGKISDKKISLSVILFIIHIALTPIHQALLLPGGSTINKYLVILIIGAMLLEKKAIIFNNSVLNSALPFVIWIGLSVLWSCAPSATISNLITIYSHIALLLMCSAYPFSNLEKRIIRYALIIASVVYAFMLIGEMLGGEDLRATILIGAEENGTESDQNMLSVNIGIAALMAFDNFKKENLKWLKTVNLCAIIIILIGILSTGSRGGIIATGVALIYLLFKLYPGLTFTKIFLIALGIAFVIYILSENSILSDYVLSRYNNAEAYEGNSGRSEIWSKYFDMMIHRPYMFIIGDGYGVENLSYGNYFNTKWPPATHNDYVSLFVSCGIIGLLFMTKLVKNCWSNAKENNNYLTKACIISALIAAISLNTITRYGFWNVLIFALINI